MKTFSKTAKRDNVMVITVIPFMWGLMIIGTTVIFGTHAGGIQITDTFRTRRNFYDVRFQPVWFIYKAPGRLETQAQD